MAHFAELNDENKVLRVLAVHNNELDDNGVESEAKGIQFLKTLFGQDTIWKQTSYNTFEGVHHLGGTPFRKNFASDNMTYDSGRDAFIVVKPFPSWTFNETTCSWDPPIPRPTFTEGMVGYRDKWDEETQAWVTVE
tara:strand:- start:7 stop:414 length:408 start_codon:yes stop_codon:yes gene_type:complete